MPTASPRYVITVYGDKYAAFLGPLLESILDRSAPTQSPSGPIGTVIWQNIRPSEVALLQRFYPNFEFVESSFPSGDDIMHAIPRKMYAWLQGAQRFPDEPVCFVDCDTVLHRPVEELFDGTWDILFTWKDELYPINTGVMMARKGEIAAHLFAAMLTRIERKLSSKYEMQVAVGSSGAADQHALREIIGFCNYDRTFSRNVSHEGVDREIRLRGVPCEQFNQTNCRPLTPDLRIIHYKTGWHPILLENAAFTANRPEAACAQMFQYWHELEERASSTGLQRLVQHAARQARSDFQKICGGYEERGILHSEMLAVCGLCRELGVERIIESGRCRGQSTLVLSRFFEGSPVRIDSIDFARDENAAFAEERLRPYAATTLHYGNSQRLIPQLLAESPQKPTAILLDGPKGFEALELARRCFAEHPNIVAVFIHDMRRGTPQRDQSPALPFRTFYTDESGYLDEFASIDDACLPSDPAGITEHTWRPNHKGLDPIPSYGPTLLVAVPRPAKALFLSKPIQEPQPVRESEVAA
jgi:hypothetical protein